MTEWGRNNDLVTAQKYDMLMQLMTILISDSSPVSYQKTSYSEWQTEIQNSTENRRKQRILTFEKLDAALSLGQ